MHVGWMASGKIKLCIETHESKSDPEEGHLEQGLIGMKIEL